MSEPWRQDLDAIRGATARLADSLETMPTAEAQRVSLQLRTANRAVWRAIDQLETRYLRHAYDVYAMLRAMAEAASMDLGEMWVQLVTNGALSIHPKALVEQARKYGVDPTKFLPDEEEE